jgi:hypothetical protein
VIVHDRDVVRIPVFPAKADAPLVVYAYAVLTGPIALELLEPVTGRDTEILELLGGVHSHELAQHGPLEVGGKPPDGLAGKEALGIPVGEAVDHPG